MENKVKISVEIPTYLKKWIDTHDISQNALVTLGLRKLFLEEQNQLTEAILKKIDSHLIKTPW